MTDLCTFRLPESIQATAADLDLARGVIRAWQRDGVLQIAIGPDQSHKVHNALTASRSFFNLPLESKIHYVSDLTYSGYTASGEEVTAGEPDSSEVFTICQDIPLDDPRVLHRWPCHGPVPWPGRYYQHTMRTLMNELATIGDRLLQLTALGLGLDQDALTRLTHDGWHHMRTLRYPATTHPGGHGLGVHTDYGMLVLTVQDNAGGLYVRPPIDGEPRNRNWLESESTAGMYEDREPWNLVQPVPGVLTAFPGDILQFLTGGTLLSTPHQAKLTTRERFSMAYFHEPDFRTDIRPLADPTSDEYLHYGTHFTNMFMRCYPDRTTTQRILRENRLAALRPTAPSRAA
jgi:2-oxoglutarate dioxygenase / 2-oxoglutarate/L-arginine monooxygenase/decarboxylase